MSGTVAQSEELHALVRQFQNDGPDEARFEELALRIAHFQAEHSPGYARLIRASGGWPEEANRLPGVPAEAFRHARVAVHGPELDVASFRTSGTTQERSGVHHFRDLRTYECGALLAGRGSLLGTMAQRPVVLCFAPHPGVPPTSSLGHMMELFLTQFDGRALGVEPRGAHFDVKGPDRWLISAQGLDVDGLRRGARTARERGEPVLLLTTGFALVALLDGLGGESLPLPRGSVVMLTGGLKGRVRQVSEVELRAGAARAFRLPAEQLVGEYGMTELSSQLYDRGGPPGPYRPPHWLRVIAVDPATERPLPQGEVGLARFVDLGNVDSAVVVQTEDLVRVTADGVELLGRRPLARLRGCSLPHEGLRPVGQGAFAEAPRSERLPAVASNVEGGMVGEWLPRQRQARHRLERLLSAARRLADGSDPLGQRARERLLVSTGLSAEGIELAFRSSWEASPSEGELWTLIHGVEPCRRAHVLLSANVFAGTLRAVAVALAASEVVAVRPSRRDPVLAELLHEATGGLFDLVSDLSPLPGDELWAYGSDVTMETLRRELPAGVRLHAHGSGFGVVLLRPVEGSRRELREWAQAIARDVTIFDQRGCLSPRVVVLADSAERTHELAMELAEALERWEEQVPRGPGAEEDREHQRSFATLFRFLGESLAAGRGVVGHAPDCAEVIVPPAGRNLQVLRAWELERVMAPWVSQITSAAVAGDADWHRRCSALLPEARLSAPGRQQSPLLDGPVDRRSGR